MNPAVQDIINAYNGLVALMPQTRKQLVSFNQQSLEVAHDMQQWLDEESITPLAYLASCFAKHAWRRKPPFGKLLGKKYKEFFELNKDDAYLWCAAIKQDQEARTPVQLPVGKEIVKKRLLAEGGARYCYDRRDLTGGFNPYSRMCQSCALQSHCS